MPVTKTLGRRRGTGDARQLLAAACVVAFGVTVCLALCTGTARADGVVEGQEVAEAPAAAEEPVASDGTQQDATSAEEAVSATAAEDAPVGESGGAASPDDSAPAAGTEGTEEQQVADPSATANPVGQVTDQLPASEGVHEADDLAASPAEAGIVEQVASAVRTRPMELLAAGGCASMVTLGVILLATRTRGAADGPTSYHRRRHYVL